MTLEKGTPTPLKGKEKSFIEGLLKSLVSIPSVNPEEDTKSKGESQISGFLAEELEKLGMHPELQKVKESSDFGLNRQNVISSLRLRSHRRTSSTRSLMLNGHVDTVPADEMSIDPFKPEIRAGFLYGRGASDMKGGIASVIAAASSLLQSDEEIDGDLILTFVVGEELHSPGIESLVTKYRADAAIVGEPTNLDLGLALKGFTHVEVEINGNPVHGSVPELGADAVEKMSKLVLAMKSKLQEKLRKRVHPLVGYPRIHPSTIRGGVSWNIVPDFCKLQLEGRTIPGESSDWVVHEIEALLEEIKNGEKEESQKKFSFKVKQVFERMPMETKEDEKIVEAIKGAFHKVNGSSPRIIGLPYWCDAGYLSAVGGIPSVILGPGTVQEAHTSTEKVKLAQVFRAAALYEEIAKRFLVGE